MFDSCVQLGEILVDSHVGSGGVQGGCPGPFAWQQHRISAGCRPVQLTTQAGSTQCPVLLISFSIHLQVHDMCMTIYKLYTQKVQK